MRKQRPRGSLTRERVVDAALAVVDEVGLDALTLRAVARSAEAPPMSLYVHFGNKSELLDFMYGEVARRLYADGGHPTWQEEFVSLCRQVRRILLEHPRWAPLLSRPAARPVHVPSRERVLELLTREGVPVGEAFDAFSNACLVSLGLTLVELNLRDSEGNSSLATRFDRLKHWSEQPSSVRAEPLTREALSGSGAFDFTHNFEAAIRAFIAGVGAGRSPGLRLLSAPEHCRR